MNSIDEEKKRIIADVVEPTITVMLSYVTMAAHSRLIGNVNMENLAMENARRELDNVVVKIEVAMRELGRHL